MTQEIKKIQFLTRKIDREKRAREEAEKLLEAKSLELFNTNHRLKKANQNLEKISTSFGMSFY